METDASEQTATLSSSHEIGGGSAGARSGYRPDPKTARDKFYVQALTVVTRHRWRLSQRTLR